MTTITDLKKSLGVGMGSRKNKYLLEMPISNGRQFNLLCQSAELPARTITTTPIWFNGRKYNTRAETDYGDTWEVTVLDDSNMSIRKELDNWLESVDNTNGNSEHFYQQEVTIWQLSSTGEKIYGYTLQNAFPSGVSEVTFGDSDENSLTEFNITFTFSEFVPIVGISGTEYNTPSARDATTLFN